MLKYYNEKGNIMFIDKTVCIPVSGGLDSYIAYRYALTLGFSKVVPMFLNYGQPYLSKELNAVDKLYGNDVIKVTADLAHEHLNNVPTLTKQEVYGRNLLIAFYGALLGDIIWLAALETEMNPTAVRDKHPEFFHLSSAVLTYVMKSLRFNVVVDTPFSNYTKSDIVSLALGTLNISKELILDTTSCYHETHLNCGICSTCFKRWISMVNNDIDEKYYSPIEKNEYGINIIKAMRKELETNIYSGRFSEKRFEETNRALLKTGLFGGSLYH
jgi:7-cyano-7-deazaguanine synthase in queuosine biosynthesis